mgnify:CR=1 FL=1
MNTFTSMRAAQASRLYSLPSQIAAPLPPREVALEGLRQRNAFLDGFFYDVGNLSEEEADQLAPNYAAEGAILAVGPSLSPSIDTWPDYQEFLAAGAGDFKALAVAGVGSSALGAAAFARNVADAIDAPVLAVVSGYGISDLVTEALGGFFLFGQLNSMRNMFEFFDDITRPGSSRPTSHSSLAEGIVRSSLDVRTLVSILSGPMEFDYMVGHSKGNLVISEALYELEEVDRDRLVEHGKTAHVITVSAKIRMPDEMMEVTDVLGQIDGFGLINSRLSIQTDERVRLAWHHTNTDIPFHLPVTETLAGIVSA